MIAAIGADVGSSVTIAIGILFVIVGAILLVLKIIRRNEGGPVVWGSRFCIPGEPSDGLVGKRGERGGLQRKIRRKPSVFGQASTDSSRGTLSDAA